MNGTVQNAMVVQFAKKLNAQEAIKWHEEEEKQRHIVDLLARTSEKRFRKISNELKKLLKKFQTYPIDEYFYIEQRCVVLTWIFG